MTAYLEIDNVSVVFKARGKSFVAVRDVDIKVEQGEFVTIIGIPFALKDLELAKLALAPNKEGESKNQPNPMASMGKTMVYMGPIITLLILSNLPSALGLYWSISTAFSLAQQVYINKKLKKISNF